VPISVGGGEADAYVGQVREAVGHRPWAGSETARQGATRGGRVAKVSISLDAELVVEVMVLAGIGSPQDAIEAIVRDYVARGHRTEARTGLREQGLREVDVKPREPEG
jgi:Arc/MetJ family transcription regulator